MDWIVPEAVVREWLVCGSSLVGRQDCGVHEANAVARALDPDTERRADS